MNKNTNLKRKRRGKVIGVGILALTVLSILPLAINQYIIKTVQSDIVDENDRDKEVINSSEDNLEISSIKAECILVLGAGLKPDGTPNHMLEDRLETAFELYMEGAASKLLLSGDHGQHEYDEVNAMKKYMLDRGVEEEDIFLDHAGFSTYDSMYRAKDIFQVSKIIVVTQKYHQYRALYIAEKLGYEAYGVCSDQRTYVGQARREIREVLARNKDFFKMMVKPEPAYLGAVIPISGSGLESWD